MAQENQNWDKVLELFFEHPSKSFTVREISRKTRVPTSTVQRYLKQLKRENLIDKSNTPNITFYFKFKKTFFMLDKIFESGLIEYLEENLKSSAIVIFGSARKGEYAWDSDIDMFIESVSNKKIDLKDFEKKLKHKIQLFIKKDINELPPDLLNNVINGIKLGGYLRIK